MVFTAPTWAPPLPEIPDTVPLCEFMLDEKHGRQRFAESLDTYTCGITGKSITARDQKTRVDHLSRALAKEFGWKVNQGSEMDKVAGVFALNTIDIMTLSWALHRINAVSSPANAAYEPDELAHQLRDSGAKVLFTVQPLLATALKAAQKANIPKSRIYLCEMAGDKDLSSEYKTLGQLTHEGASLPALEPIKWTKGQGARQVAFLCYSSGTSGLPKGVMISHRNVIANTIQIKVFDQESRDQAGGPSYHDVALGLLPQSHIYGLIVICHCSTYRGDQVIILPKFDLQNYLSAIQKYKISSLFIVPPIIIAMVKNPELLAKFDLSSVSILFTGAAPLGQETAVNLSQQFPSWKIRQGYGLTESCTVVCSTYVGDIWFGSSGCVLPGIECKVVDTEGNEITAYDQPGELLVKSPSIVLGYLNNEKANKETFVQEKEGRFLRTGDEVVIRKSPNGNEHIWVVDRIKELIKVKGLQVAPAELEACLLKHSAVADCAVIPVDDDRAGEIPKAFVVKSKEVSLEQADAAVIKSIQRYVEKEKARHKWLTGGVEFIDVIPKSPSGGGMPTSTNRTKWPVSGGAVAFQPGWFQGHSTAFIYINLGLGTVPPNMSLPMLNGVQLLGPSNNPYPGTWCFPQVPLPANVTVNVGDNATIQLIEAAKHGAALFNCVDITFAADGDPDIPEVNTSNCFNSSDITYDLVFSTTSLQQTSVADALQVDAPLPMPHTNRKKKNNNSTIRTKRILVVEDDTGWTRVTKQSNNINSHAPTTTSLHEPGVSSPSPLPSSSIPHLRNFIIPADASVAKTKARYKILEQRWLGSESWTVLKAALTSSLTPGPSLDMTIDSNSNNASLFKGVYHPISISTCILFGSGSPTAHAQGWIDRHHVALTQIAEPKYNDIDTAFLHTLGIETRFKADHGVIAIPDLDSAQDYPFHQQRLYYRVPFHAGGGGNDVNAKTEI
ncbi:hypothetical protein DV736_g1733, partial [Chaetothyriales sp. CBS 134916]